MNEVNDLGCVRRTAAERCKARYCIREKEDLEKWQKVTR